MPTKVHLVKAVDFLVVMYGCESWTIKKAECRRIDVFELWCCRRPLRAPWTARRSSQSILKEISHEYSLERLMLKLKLQYCGHLMQRVDSFEKTLMLGGIGGRRRRGQQGMRRLDGITDSMDVSLSEWTPGDGDEQGGLACCNSWGRKESDTTERLNWTELDCPSGFHEHSCLKTATLGYDFWISCQALPQGLPLSVGTLSGGTSPSRLSSLLIWSHATMVKQFQATNFYLTTRGRQTY